MPSVLFEPRCDRNRPSLHDVGELAQEFQTSLTATALRFVMFSPEPCAVVQSTKGVVDWVDWSADFRPAITKGARLDRRTYAVDLLSNRDMEDRAALVDEDAWGSECGVDLWEHSRKVADTTVLSFLWHAC